GRDPVVAWCEAPAGACDPDLWPPSGRANRRRVSCGGVAWRSVARGGCRTHPPLVERYVVTAGLRSPGRRPASPRDLTSHIASMTLSPAAAAITPLSAEQGAEVLRRVHEAVASRVVGQDAAIEDALVVFLARGHL